MMFDPAPEMPMDPAAEMKMAAGTAKSIGIGVGISKARDFLDNKLQSISNATPARVNSLVNRMGDPDHESELANIRTRAMLTDMLSRDSVISGHDPRAVADAFNELSQLAPRMATQPLMARPFLRKQLEMGHLDSFEGNEALGAEGKLRDLHTPKPAPAEKPEAGGKPDASKRRD